ncbi:MAG: acyl-CoA thioesterase [Alphaproteobacteria bacterium]|nr:acyl-CoA thioesterase [Alphaproteobacteria bacterium]MCL2889702.1 acyl-CoA thioesterase [Alphaproteobacteria bacterium]
MRTHYFPFTIAFADTDAGGIVYHARYIEIAERARMAWQKSFGPLDQEIGFIVRSLSAKYMQPLFLGDDFIVETVATDVGNVSLSVEQKFVKDGEICAILNFKIGAVGMDRKPRKIPSEWAEFF